MKPSKAPNIFEYNNFREFLRDLYQFIHARNKKFNKAYVCYQLGLPNSRSYFQNVLMGKYVSNIKMPLFIKVFKLTKEEGAYFRVLVNYNQTNDPEEKELLLDQLISLNRTPKEIVPPQIYEYYKEWYHSVVRALLNTFDFTDNFETLARKIFPAITVQQAHKSISLLRELKLIEKNERGFFKPTAKVISTGSTIKDEIIRQFQLKAIDTARKVIASNHDMPQKIITKVISMSEDAYKQIEKRVGRFNAEITSIVHKDETPADRVYHMDLLLYPVSKRKK
jgi:uncharacterized protein (TIGR02147 family)